MNSNLCTWVGYRIPWSAPAPNRDRPQSAPAPELKKKAALDLIIRIGVGPEWGRPRSRAAADPDQMGSDVMIKIPIYTRSIVVK